MNWTDGYPWTDDEGMSIFVVSCDNERLLHALCQS